MIILIVFFVSCLMGAAIAGNIALIIGLTTLYTRMYRPVSQRNKKRKMVIRPLIAIVGIHGCMAVIIETMMVIFC